jgi:undecaprenyl-diphosphatase
MISPAYAADGADGAAPGARRTTAPLPDLSTKVALGAGALAFLGLAALASRRTPNRFDVAITRTFQVKTPPNVARAMRLISAPGYAPFTHSIVLTLAANCWAAGRKRDAIFAVGTMGAGFTTGIVKMLIKRPRPDDSFRMQKRLLKDHSFPSGHATHYTAFYGYVFFLANRYLPHGPIRTFLMAYCALLVASVGPSRTYLGHHWASDVAAGQLVGLVYLLAMLQAYKLFDPLPG